MSTFELSVLQMRVDDSIFKLGRYPWRQPPCSTMKSLSDDNITVYIESLTKMQILAGYGDENCTDGGY